MPATALDWGQRQPRPAQRQCSVWCSEPLPACRVQQENVESLMRAALPYHQTPQFVRLVQILHLSGTLFEFLAPMQRSGAALPRGVLVERCLVDRVSKSS